jgi:hypothetical protein
MPVVEIAANSWTDAACASVSSSFFVSTSTVNSVLPPIAITSSTNTAELPPDASHSLWYALALASNVRPIAIASSSSPSGFGGAPPAIQ